MRDLAPDGYFSPDEPPDALDDSKKIIQMLAKFHAASFYLAENVSDSLTMGALFESNFIIPQNQCDFSNFNHSLFRSPDIVKGFFEKCLQTFREVVGTWSGCESFLPKLDEYNRNIADIGRRIYTARQPGHGFNVLNHGDFHEANILIKADSESRLEDIRFVCEAIALIFCVTCHCHPFQIDFQLSIYCSPSVDLIFMFDLVKWDENGEMPKDDLIEFYHMHFVDALKAFGFSKPSPSLADVKEELMRDGPLQVLRSIFFVPFRFVGEVERPESEPDGRDTNHRKLLYNFPKCKAMFLKLLDSWVEKGWI